ncbi:MAG TPA: response regulator transcription factor [Verrucomicrobiae bacterium]|jgi:DNA-binding NarL/FixJ family response regulator|nr:response regulator transcription factor [Verrucomicrobiae bacterium]
MKTNPSNKKPEPGPAKKGARKVLLLDDHPVMREGLAQLINHEADLEVCGQFEDAAPAFEAVPKLQPDVAIIDLSLKGSSGLELVKNIKANYPKIPLLVLSMHDESLYAERALRAGASGYLMKAEATEVVLNAIRHVLNGGIHLSEKMSSKLMHQLASGRTGGGTLMERLSDRELEVFSLIGQGRGTRQIAEQLHLSVKTIESHRAHIKEKLNLKNATELVHRAIQMRENNPPVA